MRTSQPVVIPPGLGDKRARLIVTTASKWMNGSTLSYAFYAGPTIQKDAVRAAFAEWKALGIGLIFTEVASVASAQIRIGFNQAIDAAAADFYIHARNFQGSFSASTAAGAAIITNSPKDFQAVMTGMIIRF